MGFGERFKHIIAGIALTGAAAGVGHEVGESAGKKSGYEAGEKAGVDEGKAVCKAEFDKKQVEAVKVEAPVVETKTEKEIAMEKEEFARKQDGRAQKILDELYVLHVNDNEAKLGKVSAGVREVSNKIYIEKLKQVMESYQSWIVPEGDYFHSDDGVITHIIDGLPVETVKSFVTSHPDLKQAVDSMFVRRTRERDKASDDLSFGEKLERDDDGKGDFKFRKLTKDEKEELQGLVDDNGITLESLAKIM